MNKIFITAFLILSVLGGAAAAQTTVKTRKIGEIIADSEKTRGMLAGLLGDATVNAPNAETMVLTALTFPNDVRVKYLGETQKTGKTRKKAIDKWLTDYNRTPDERKFYVKELAVEEDGTRYWIVAHAENVLEKLARSVKKGDEVILRLRFLGYHRKGPTTDYFLLAESVR